jgi:hypothetical protein
VRAGALGLGATGLGATIEACERLRVGM